MNVFLPRFVRFAALTLFCLLAWLTPAVHVRAAAQPVTVKELCLMLRTGYTDDEVLRETSGRPLLEPLDADNEKLLRAAGADTRLVNALRVSHPALTADQAAAARAQQAAIDERNTQSRDAGRAGLLAYYKQNVDTHLAERKDAAMGKYAAALRGQLVTLTDVGLKPYDDAVLANKKLFAFYFAALTNPNCEKFTPQLVKFYRDFAPKHPAFELVFVSEDRSAYNMENHMRQDAMPWPALDFDRRAQQPDLAKLGQEVVPRLVVLDGMGRVVSDSIVNGQYVGPQHVLDDLTGLANGTAPAGDAPPVVPAAAPAAAAPSTASPDHVAGLLRGKLVRFANGGLQAYDDDRLAGKKLFAFYYSAHWCGPCRQFTPQLVAFYKQMAAAHPEFEIVFISEDHSAEDMKHYMEEVGMPWAALRFEQKAQAAELTHYEGPGIPDLVVVDGAGRVVADSYQGEKYVGPQPVMAYLGQLLTKNGG